MYELNGIKMFSADDIKTAFHVSWIWTRTVDRE